MGFRWGLVLDLSANRTIYHFSFSLVNVALGYVEADLRVDIRRSVERCSRYALEFSILETLGPLSPTISSEFFTGTVSNLDRPRVRARSRAARSHRSRELAASYLQDGADEDPTRALGEGPTRTARRKSRSNERANLRTIYEFSKRPRAISIRDADTLDFPSPHRIHFGIMFARRVLRLSLR